jgi:membrane fusion protein (multidrug efflux system)
MTFITAIVVITMSCFLLCSCKGKDALENRKELAGRPVASVKAVAARKGTITQILIVYGSVIPAPGSTQMISVPFESQVRRILVDSGQKVSPGDVLIEIVPSLNASLQFERAQTTYEAMTQNLQHTQELYNLRLATNTQLLQAKQALSQAQLNLENMKKQGLGGKRELRSERDGIVQKILVREGTVVPPGNPLAEIIAKNNLEVSLGVELEDVRSVQVNQSISLASINASATHTFTGRIRKVSQSVNPATRLIDVYVPLHPSAGFLPGEAVKGILTIGSDQGLIVPKSAVLPEGGHYILFIVKNGQAVKRVVRVGLKNDKEVEVMGDGLLPGDLVVILGNYELKDGMSVTVKDAQ